MKIIYFASVRDRVGRADEELSDLEDSFTIEDLIEVLSARGEAWKSALKDQRLLFAKNQEIVSIDTPISVNDEIAIMPPVTGG